MKNQTLIFMLIMMLFFVCCKQQEKDSKAQETEIIETLPEPSTAEIEKVVEHFNAAMVNPSKEVLESLCSNGLTYGHSSGLIQNKEEFINDLINGPFDFSSVSAPEQTIHLTGNTAVVRHIFLASAIKEGQQLEIRIGNIQVYRRAKDGSWKLFARQAYKL